MKTHCTLAIGIVIGLLGGVCLSGKKPEDAQHVKEAAAEQKKKEKQKLREQYLRKIMRDLAFERISLREAVIAFLPTEEDDVNISLEENVRMRIRGACNLRAIDGATDEEVNRLRKKLEKEATEIITPK